jgi:ubiquinol-cytochrome c reductase cytochrome b/c1 subunit
MAGPVSHRVTKAPARLDHSNADDPGWGAAAMSDPKDRSLTRETGLFIVLLVLVNGLVLPGSASAAELMAAFYLASFIHLGFTLYDGSFSALRRATWLLFIGSWAGAELAAFFGFAVPSGQLSLWLISNSLIGERLAGWFRTGSTWIFGSFDLLYLLPLLALVLDITVAHYGRWRRSSLLQITIFLAAVAAGAILLGLALGAFLGTPMPHSPGLGISPYLMYQVPFYALLRAVPDKLAGVLLTLAALLIPIIWPWMRADLLRLGTMRRVWALLCLALAAAYIGLAYLGLRPPEGASLRTAQALAAFYFAFFLIFPPVLHRLSPEAAPKY